MSRCITHPASPNEFSSTHFTSEGHTSNAPHAMLTHVTHQIRSIKKDRTTEMTSITWITQQIERGMMSPEAEEQMRSCQQERIVGSVASVQLSSLFCFEETMSRNSSEEDRADRVPVRFSSLCLSSREMLRMFHDIFHFLTPKCLNPEPPLHP
jgi:hypothetical protein